MERFDLTELIRGDQFVCDPLNQNEITLDFTAGTVICVGG